RCRPSWRRALGDLPRAHSGRWQPTRHAQIRRVAPTRSADEGAQKIRPAWRAQTLPIFEALIQIALAAAVSAAISRSADETPASTITSASWLLVSAHPRATSPRQLALQPEQVRLGR